MTEPNTNNLILKLDKEYLDFLNNIKGHLRLSKTKASIAVNTELIKFYWYVGHEILSIQSIKRNWGSKFLEQLSQDLHNAIPGMTGFSKRNLEYMRLFASLYPNEDLIAQQPAAQLPWAHNYYWINSETSLKNVNGMPLNVFYMAGLDRR